MGHPTKAPTKAADTDTKVAEPTAEVDKVAEDQQVDREEARAQLAQAHKDLKMMADTLTEIADHNKDADIVDAVKAGGKAKDILGTLLKKKQITTRELTELNGVMIEAMNLTTALAVASRDYTDQQVGELRTQTGQTFLAFSEHVEGEFNTVHGRIDQIVETPRHVWVISAISGVAGWLLYYLLFAELMGHDGGTRSFASIIAGISVFALVFALLPREREEVQRKSVKLKFASTKETDQQPEAPAAIEGNAGDKPAADTRT